MSPEWQGLIRGIHSSASQQVIAVTGGGTSAIADLLVVPGGSHSVLEAIVPYAPEALASWLGRRPEKFCADETALAMAAVAFERAGQLQAAAHATERGAENAGLPSVPGPAVGVACTASLVSDRPKHGEHRCHVATQTATTTTCDSLVLDKGARDRAGEEALVGQLILSKMAQAAGVALIPDLCLRKGECIVSRQSVGNPLVVELLRGSRRLVWSLPGGLIVDSLAACTQAPASGPALGKLSGAAPSRLPFAPPVGLLCGAFNPLHAGHRELRNVASRRLGGPVYFEMSLKNVDKPPLDFLTIADRLRQFDEFPLALTAAPTFAEKSLALAGVTFVVGVDTAERIIQPRYYGDSTPALEQALTGIRDSGCRFLVAGRASAGKFLTLDDLPLPPAFANLFSSIPADEFREDISSTQLRQGAG